MVRFFGKPRKATAAERAAHEAASTPASRDKPAAAEEPKKTTTRRITDKRKTPAATTESAPAPPPAPPAAAEPAPATKRRSTTASTRTTRPPRRDWAAEAAATPIDTPAPAPTSLASSPAEDDAPGAPTKRRRGTRGGRGRKKPGDVSANGAEPATAPTREPVSLEQAVSQQADTLERFTREMTAAMKSLQETVSDLQRGGGIGAQTSHPRVALFVDVPNVIYAAERRNVNIDFGRVLDYFTQGRELVRATAYAPITDDPKATLESQRFVHHFVGHPYRLITKPLKRFADGSMKANFDIELAIDILTMSDRLDVVVLMSGDGDFRRVVELVASRGVRVEVVAFSETASSELKSVADLYIDIGANLDKFRLR